jgi:hypothetical protein
MKTKTLRRSERIKKMKSNLLPYPSGHMKPVCSSHIMVYYEEWKKSKECLVPEGQTFEEFFWQRQYYRNLGIREFKSTYATTVALKYIYEKPWQRFLPCTIDWDVVYTYGK